MTDTPWTCAVCGKLNSPDRTTCKSCNNAKGTPGNAGTVQVQYDNQDQYKRIAAYIIPGETLHAVYDCKGGGTGFVGITDQRIIFYDQGFLTKKKSMVSLPYHRIVGIASADEGVLFKTSEITLLTAAGNFNFEFRGSDKAHWVYRFVMNQILNQANPQLAG